MGKYAIKSSNLILGFPIKKLAKVWLNQAETGDFEPQGIVYEPTCAYFILHGGLICISFCPSVTG